MHEGAVLVLKHQSAVEIDRKQAEDLAGVKPGLNLPIPFHDRIVGVVGVTGQSNEVRHFGQLVKMAAEMLLQHSFYWSKGNGGTALRRIGRAAGA